MRLHQFFLKQTSEEPNGNEPSLKFHKIYFLTVWCLKLFLVECPY